MACFWMPGIVLVATVFIYWRVFVPASLPEWRSAVRGIGHHRCTCRLYRS
jgi:hypothetical protein